MLKLNNINVWFGENHVLKNISCHVEPGDFIVIVGTNGAGKTTLFDTIAGTIEPQSGTITLNDVDITRMNESQRAIMITRIFQNTHLNSVGSLTVEQNLAIARYSRRRARFINGMKGLPRHEAENLIHSLGMQTDILDQPMNTLSGGQRQLVAFGMATQLIPKLLLLDEPTAALDPQASTMLLHHAVHFINRHRITTLLITHDPYVALNVGNKVWILDQGKITRQYNQEEKETLKPDHLIGSINYEKIAQANR